MSQQMEKLASTRKILVIDDDPQGIDIILEPLKWEGYDTLGVHNLEDGLKIIDSWMPLIIILDFKEKNERFEALAKIRDIRPLASLLLLSDESSTDSIIHGLDSGADDYIVKPFVPLELLARIRTHLRIRDLQEQLLFANEKLKELADTDDLTGLYNMRSLYQKLDFEMQRARRFERQVCVIMFDLDHFKSVNDGHDHLFGSFVITEVGKIVRANTRNIDIPARYGGDEFLIVLTEVNFDGAYFFCERLRKSVEGTVFRSGEDSIQLTISVGFGMTDPKESITPKELVRRADHALYEAKESGRNKVCYYKMPGITEFTQSPNQLVLPAQGNHQGNFSSTSSVGTLNLNKESEGKPKIVGTSGRKKKKVS
ncbi:MAG: diguanylate cyclase [Bdellovibrionaceae bacterium]|nr:diguanylate cyclase [Pseudobdellovibrionaceae bacterium]NUM59258.1 diguanylate cyclase [Pseudobdellovibrionaceae bacterium]